MSNVDDAFERAYGPPKLDTKTTTSSPTGSRTGDGGSSTTRVFRSKSLHHPRAPPVPPPPRRKRPESIQVLPAPPPTPHSPSLFEVIDGESVGYGEHFVRVDVFGSSKGNFDAVYPLEESFIEFELGSGSGSSPLRLGHFQRTLATLQPRFEALQPKLDKARYKAEAGLSRRGFVRGAVGVAGHSGNGPMIYGKTAAELQEEEGEGEMVKMGFGVDVASRRDEEEGESGEERLDGGVVGCGCWCWSGSVCGEGEGCSGWAGQNAFMVCEEKIDVVFVESNVEWVFRSGKGLGYLDGYSWNAKGLRLHLELFEEWDYFEVELGHSKHVRHWIRLAKTDGIIREGETNACETRCFGEKYDLAIEEEVLVGGIPKTKLVPRQHTVRQEKEKICLWFS
ncbi:hypothetical protein BDN72DRAFT_863892 [Pluteus cervinus]|uniref:Uncharacterized protein n=1 Tax=Pluteus cervinus TaxID=181527 RepID=A0ACD3A684_9AGAR|nr:hypothetical protein BDN72DRAFT_863892 [Pluteus cervinus]